MDNRYPFVGIVGFLLCLSHFSVQGQVQAGEQATSTNFVAQVKSKPDDPLAVDYACLSSTAKYAQSGSPVDLGSAVKAAKRLLQLKVTDGNGRTGWSYTHMETVHSAKCGQPGALDAFSDGTCNPPDTPYMIQTGYAIACLAQVYMATGDRQYRDLAWKAVKDSWELGSAPKDCPDCHYYYWYSYHKNDYGRYVRATNLNMALGLAWLYAATGDEALKRRVSAVTEAERRELRHGNYGYFGIDDPRYLANVKGESQHIENHVGHQIKALKDIAIILGQPALLNDATALLSAYMNCNNNRCRPGNCAEWAAPPSCKATFTASPCILEDVDRQFKEACELARQSLGVLNPFQVFITMPSSVVRGMVDMKGRNAPSSK